ncbi:MAG: DCC1-like thiol-disulfide oxidoreductase family protein [Sediminibacterium sp.]|nr:DCC1-like thiol-disulfide oxidoreductase family protein [Sediminibacterium sp.]
MESLLEKDLAKIAPISIIFFDGECMMCNRIMTFIVKKNNPHIFFCDLNSSKATELLAQFSIDNEIKSTIYFVSQYKVYNKSTAVIKILKILYPKNKILIGLFYIIPLGLRNFIYSFIAKHRKKIYAAQNCYVPTSQQKAQFLHK